MNDQVKVGDEIIVTADIYADDGCLHGTELTVTKLTDGGVWASRISGDMILEFRLREDEFVKITVAAEKLLKNGKCGKINATKRRNTKPGAPSVLNDARVVRDGEQIGYIFGAVMMGLIGGMGALVLILVALT